jgi:hypothetical protein
MVSALSAREKVEQVSECAWRYREQGEYVDCDNCGRLVRRFWRSGKLLLCNWCVTQLFNARLEHIENGASKTLQLAMRFKDTRGDER